MKNGPDAEKQTRKPGRPAFVPTDEHRAEVRRLVADGVVHGTIAKVIGLSLPALRKHFREDLAARMSEDNLFAVATDGEVPPPAPRPAPVRRPGVGGRKAFRPTEDLRRRVSLLVAAGSKSADIARVLGVTEPTLRRHFGEELSLGALRKRAEVLEALDRAAKKGNVAAQKEMLAIMDKAALDTIGDELRSVRQDKPEAEAPVGKKVQAARDAVDMVTNDEEWGSLLGRAH